MVKVVIDTDIIIDFTRGKNELFQELLNQASQKKVVLFIPAVVVTELMTGQETHNNVKLRDLEFLINQLSLVGLDYYLAKKAGFLMRDFKVLKLGDAIIAAVTIELDAKLATRNKKDFENIKGLKFYKAKNVNLNPV